MESKNIESLWTHLHWLTILAQQGSYTGAATRLGVSKAAVSQRIAELERAAGVSLVQRTTRSMRLTEAGQRLVDETQAQYEHIARSFSSAKDSAGVARGIVRVTAPVAFARQQLTPHISPFLRAHPEVRLQLELSDHLSSLSTEGFDLAIRHSATAPDTHVAWKLCDTATVIVATRAYLKRAGTPLSPEELTGHNCLFYPRAQEVPAWAFERIDTCKSSVNRVTVPISGSFAANNSESLRDAVLDDLGIALLPDFTAQQGLRSGKLVKIMPDWLPVGAFANHLYVLRPYSSHVPRAVSEFVAHLRKVFQSGFDS
ncbi:LysR family transcriptional regulator [Glaciimonas immobilis]|uniref:DNA-binding transcriptional LysR family regulator n=1 Tax=Glaciimonas immobilis TaxID=728004 RepID=A0A840RWY9_9BURK|nr:LysR family transcriptional regulator [Glaciimonas immobilis]KAF3996560.1 LysR family transcriptional regulator [Glaciimonas immobilis]MBB5201071.1 DNA-binding transcriptional LysR family regulator [Glaciimonas immobilis]